MSIDELFLSELRRRGVAFNIEPETGRYVVDSGDGRMLVNIENLRRDFERDGDEGRISRFIDSVLAACPVSSPSYSPDRLYWCMEPNDYDEPADYRVPLSDRMDRVLVALSPDRGLITWVTPEILKCIGLSEAEASAKAFENLDSALDNATIEIQDICGTKVAFLSTVVPFKASLILAPGLKKQIEATIGWPVSAITPDRASIYIWASQQTDFVSQVGSVVVQEYKESS